MWTEAIPAIVSSNATSCCCGCCCCYRYDNEVGVCRSRSADIEQQGRERQEKIARFRRRKQLEESLKELRLAATKDHADDEITVSIRSVLMKQLSFKL